MKACGIFAGQHTLLLTMYFFGELVEMAPKLVQKQATR